MLYRSQCFTTATTSTATSTTTHQTSGEASLRLYGGWIFALENTSPLHSVEETGNYKVQSLAMINWLSIRNHIGDCTCKTAKAYGHIKFATHAVSAILTAKETPYPRLCDTCLNSTGVLTVMCLELTLISSIYAGQDWLCEVKIVVKLTIVHFSWLTVWVVLRGFMFFLQPDYLLMKYYL